MPGSVVPLAMLSCWIKTCQLHFFILTIEGESDAVCVENVFNQFDSWRQCQCSQACDQQVYLKTVNTIVNAEVHLKRVKKDSKYSGTFEKG